MDEQTLRDEVVSRTLSVFPDARLIVLFGSRARGDARPDSDVDLLVVAETDQRPAHRGAAIRRAMWGLALGFDILVFTPRELELEKEWSSSVVHRALREGIALHEAA